MKKIIHLVSLAAFSLVVAIATPTFVGACWESCEYGFIPTGLQLLIPSELWLAWFHPLTAGLIVGKAGLFFLLLSYFEKHSLPRRTRVLCVGGIIAFYVLLPVALHFFLEARAERIRQLPRKHLALAHSEISNDFTKTQVLKTLSRYDLDSSVMVNHGNRSYLLGNSYQDANAVGCFTDCLSVVVQINPEQDALGYCFFQGQLVLRYGNVLDQQLYYDAELGKKAMSLLPKCDGNYNVSCVQDRLKVDEANNIMGQCSVSRVDPPSIR